MADIIIGQYLMKPVRQWLLESSNAYDSCPIVFVVPPGRPWSPVRKLFILFQPEVWLVGIFSMSLVLISVCFVNLQSPRIRRTILGEDVHIPLLNLVAGMLGVSTPTYSKKSAARLIWMGFVLTCLVTRTVYQASLYKLLRGSGHEAEVQTIDEATEKQFTLYIRKSYGDMTSILFRKRPMVKIVEDWNETLLNATFDPNFKGAVLRSRIQVLYLNQKNINRFNYKVMKENFVSAPVVFYYNKNFFLKTAIDVELGKLQAAGLVHYWTYQKYFDSKLSDRTRNHDEDTKKPLSPDYMKINYQILVSGAALSTLVFAAEILSKKCKK